MTDDTESSVTVEVYYLHRGPRGEKRGQRASNLRHELSIMEKIEAPADSHMDLYDWQASENLSPDETDDHTLLKTIWKAWNGPRSPEWSNYKPHNTRSMEVGDIVTVDGRAYWCASIGWERAPHLDNELEGNQ